MNLFIMVLILNYLLNLDSPRRAYWYLWKQFGSYYNSFNQFKPSLHTDTSVFQEIKIDLRVIKSKVFTGNK